MSTSSKLLAVAAIALTAGACKDVVKGIQDKAALSSALVSSGGLGSGAGSFGAYAVFMVNPGSLTPSAAAPARLLNADITGVASTSYEGAVGIQVIYTNGANHETFTGVVGWDGFNSTAQTVDEIVMAGATTATSTPAGTGDHTINGSDGVATYWTRSPNVSYAGDSGTFTLTSATFNGGATDCTSVLAQAGATVTSCSYKTGTMSGNFTFHASGMNGGTPVTYSQSGVTYASLPAVQITVVH